MADATSKKLVRLLDPDLPPEIRKSALIVLPEIGSADAEVAKALLPCIEHANPELRVLAIQAAGRLKIQEALPLLLSRVQEGGEGAEQAAQSASRLGPKAVRALHDLMPKVAPGLRRYIASALGSAGSAGADHAALEFLQDSDPGVVEATVRSLIAQVPEITPAKRKALAESLLELLDNDKIKLPPASETAAVRLLAGLGDERAQDVLWPRTNPGRPAELRIAALQALGKLAPTPSKNHLKVLFGLAAERDFRIAAPALMILQHQPVNAKNLSEWIGLLQAADVTSRRLALDKLEGQDADEVAEALLTQIRHPDREFREKALHQLTQVEKGRKRLIDALLEAETPDAAWNLARAQAPFAKKYPAAQRDKLLLKACSYLEAGDRRVDALLFLLREADDKALHDALEERGLAQRKKKAYEKALLYFRLLSRDPASGFSLRFELAACGLKLSHKELAHEARLSDPCLGQFGHLVQHYEPELASQIDKCKWLDPEDLFYLGFHFAEKDGVPKHFGAKMLKLVVKRSPKSKTGQAAKTKLKSLVL